MCEKHTQARINFILNFIQKHTHVYYTHTHTHSNCQKLNLCLVARTDAEYLQEEIKWNTQNVNISKNAGKFGGEMSTDTGTHTQRKRQGERERERWLQIMNITHLTVNGGGGWDKMKNVCEWKCWLGKCAVKECISAGYSTLYGTYKAELSGRPVAGQISFVLNLLAAFKQ